MKASELIKALKDALAHQRYQHPNTRESLPPPPPPPPPPAEGQGAR